MKFTLSIFIAFLTLTAFGKIKTQNINDFLPKGFIILENIKGDLNKDGTEDVVLLLKATDKKQFVVDEYRGKLDRNRRGLIILFNKRDSFAPELSIILKEGNLHISYGHGRYGSWTYIFRFSHHDFKLIGHESIYKSNYASDEPTFDETSINFLTKKKLIKEVIKVSPSGKHRLRKN